MKEKMKHGHIISIFILSVSMVISISAQTSVSSDIHIVKGEKSRRSVTTVSGDIVIGNNADVKASITSVSGDIKVGAKADVEHVETVSGDISIGKGVSTHNLETVSGDIQLYARSDVRGSIETVSGDITCATGSKIRETLSTVSGDIELDDTTLKNHLITVSGDISLYNGAIIEGDIIIDRESKLFMHDWGRLKVIIDMNSVVKGNIRVKESDTNVIVYLTNGGKVNGEIINAEVRKQ